jgi:hypothetical protein
MMKGQSAEAHLEICSRAGKTGGKRTHSLHPNLASEIGKRLMERPNHAREMGKRTQELKVGIFSLTTEQNIKNGKLSHALKGEDGKSVHAVKMGNIGGKIAGKIAVESGQMARMNAMRTPEIRSKTGKMSTHLRWHVNRADGFNPAACSLCFQVV